MSASSRLRHPAGHRARMGDAPLGLPCHALPPLPILSVVALGILLLVPLTPSRAATPVVQGISDRAVVADRATLRIPSVPGSLVAATLDGTSVPLDTPYPVEEVDYHELLVTQAPPSGSPSETNRIRFIVRASERGNTEWGLPAWTPPAPVASGPLDLAQGRLRLFLPARFPAGLPVPVAAWLEGPDGRPVRANARLESSLHSPIWLRRGVGSGRLPPQPTPGTREYTARIPGQSATRTLEIEGSPVWTTSGGTLPADTVWPAEARVALETTLTVPAGVRLEVGPGSVLRLGPGVDIVIQGTLALRGTRDRPVTLLAGSADRPWGGLQVRGPSARLEAEATLMVDSGADPSWFDTHSGYDVHRREQALLLVDGGSASLVDCAALDGRGQFGHGRNADLELRGTLVQRFITGGEYNGGSVRIRGSALVEFPRDDATFDDADNDALYLTTGHHEVTDTLIGWAKDDGIDAGSGGAGSVLASNVWAEAIYHEAFAWSGGGRVVTNLHCVALHCGQGIECGWSTGQDSPRVFASDCLVLGNLSGVRFGDNYDWSYNGFLRVTQSLLLHNHRDIFDLNWGDWTPHPAQMDLRGNLVSRSHSRYPENELWRPDGDAERLGTFLDGPPDALPGIGFVHAVPQASLTGARSPLRIGLSRFSSKPASVGYSIRTADNRLVSGRLEFAPGQTLQSLSLPPAAWSSPRPVQVLLHDPEGAELTGASVFHLLPASGNGPETLVPAGARWRYLDTGVDPGDAWPFPGFDDSTWAEGPAELGYGDGDEATVIAGGPSGNRHPTCWFRHRFLVSDPARFTELEIRLRRDDGALVHLNGREAFRSNLPPGPLTAGTYTGQGTTSESTYFTSRVPADFLRPGENVMAVEVHQSGPTSSDVSFDLELVAYPALRLRFTRIGEQAVLLWDSAGFELQSAPTPAGPWQTVSGAASPVSIPPLPTPTFHRLRQTGP